MTTPPVRTAIIIGASLGIREALARELNREGWCLGLLVRRLDRLEALREALGRETVVRRLDVAVHGELQILQHFLGLRAVVIRSVAVANSTERAVIIEEACRFRAVWRTQQAATGSNKKQHAATPGNRQQLDRNPAVNLRVAGSNPA
jgi:NAD(P)-dependent dehydrogenase (short-subunit alcohol dehydrogenase family)